MEHEAPMDKGRRGGRGGGGQEGGDNLKISDSILVCPNHLGGMTSY